MRRRRTHGWCDSWWCIHTHTHTRARSHKPRNDLFRLAQAGVQPHEKHLWLSAETRGARCVWRGAIGSAQCELCRPQCTQFVRWFKWINEIVQNAFVLGAARELKYHSYRIHKENVLIVFVGSSGWRVVRGGFLRVAYRYAICNASGVCMLWNKLLDSFFLLLQFWIRESLPPLYNCVIDGQRKTCLVPINIFSLPPTSPALSDFGRLFVTGALELAPFHCDPLSTRLSFAMVSTFLIMHHRRLIFIANHVSLSRIVFAWLLFFHHRNLPRPTALLRSDTSVFIRRTRATRPPSWCR